MDIDTLHKDLQALKHRLEPLLEEYEAHRRGTIAKEAEAVREKAASRLDEGEFDKAGKLLGIERSHDGAEDDESYERRLRAELHGAEAADAVGPRESTVEAPAETYGRDEGSGDQN